MISIEDIRKSPNYLSKYYKHAAVAHRIQLTGHIHQAMPDVCGEAYQEHWDCVNKLGEERWDDLFDIAYQVRSGFASLLNCTAEDIALGDSTHDLFCRFLSALPERKVVKILSTDAEHPSISRQLERLNEAGRIELVKVPANPASQVVERLVHTLDDSVDAVCISAVNYQTGHLILELDTLWPVCEKFGCELYVDAYQSINLQPFCLEDYNLTSAFVSGGGNKYCQMGDGVCFLYVPPARDFKPLLTSWFASFDPIIDDPAALPIAYSDDATRFFGSSRDGLPWFRAMKSFEFFKKHEMDPDWLFDVNHHQLNYLATQFAEQELPESIISMPVDVEYMGGFLGLTSPYAEEICGHMRDRGVHSDFCRDWLRLGPAPYLSDEHLADGVIALAESVQEVIHRLGRKANG